MSLCTLALAYTVSIFGGHIVARYWVLFLRKQIDPQYDVKAIRSFALDWSIGFVERGIATTLIILTPSLAPAFVGGWIVLKFASAWDKRSAGGDAAAENKNAKERMVALIGSVVSLTIGVLGGLIANPSALATVGNPN